MSFRKKALRDGTGLTIIFQTTEAICFIHGWVWMPVTRGVAAITPLRGLPDDIELQWDEDGCDDYWGEHSQTWLLSDEILASTSPVAIEDDEPGSVVAEFCAEVQRLHGLHGTVRIVLGFTG